MDCRTFGTGQNNSPVCLRRTDGVLLIIGLFAADARIGSVRFDAASTSVSLCNSLNDTLLQISQTT